MIFTLPIYGVYDQTLPQDSTQWLMGSNGQVMWFIGARAAHLQAELLNRNERLLAGPPYKRSLDKFVAGMLDEVPIRVDVRG